MRFQPSKRTLILFSAVLLLEIGFGVGMFTWQQSYLRELQAELQVKQSDAAEGARLARRFEETRLALEADQAQIEFLEGHIPDADYIPTLLRDLETLALETQNRLVGVRPEPREEARPASSGGTARDREIERATGAEESASARKPTAPLPYDAFHIRASMTGGYGQILAFLHRLTRFPKIVGVEEVHIRPIVQTDSGGPRHLLQVEVRLKAYVLKERAGTAAGATTGAV